MGVMTLVLIGVFLGAVAAIAVCAFIVVVFGDGRMGKEIKLDEKYSAIFDDVEKAAKEVYERLIHKVIKDRIGVFHTLVLNDEDSVALAWKYYITVSSFEVGRMWNDIMTFDEFIEQVIKGMPNEFKFRGCFIQWFAGTPETHWFVGSKEDKTVKQDLEKHVELLQVADDCSTKVIEELEEKNAALAYTLQMYTDIVGAMITKFMASKGTNREIGKKLQILQKDAHKVLKGAVI